MPELPEVETIRRDLERSILNKKIVQVIVFQKKAVRDTSFHLEEKLLGDKVKTVERVGKLLMFGLWNSKLFLLIHLKMTGQLIFINNQKYVVGGHSLVPDKEETTKSHAGFSIDLPDKHTQVSISFEKNGTLFFNDMRRFGYARLVTKEQKEKIEALYGIEPLRPNFTLGAFVGILQKKKTNLKALLLKQEYIAGIGNIYADEICHAAGVMPSRIANTLTQIEIEKLYQATNKVIAKAVEERGTTFNSYVDGDGNKGNFVKHLKVYERDGQRCLTCKKGVIHKKKIAGRGTHYCPLCQH